MRIICPNCGFAAEVDLARLSPKAAVANCPQCGHRFRFRRFGQDVDNPASEQDDESLAGPSGVQYGGPYFAGDSGRMPEEPAEGDIPPLSPSRPHSGPASGPAPERASGPAPERASGRNSPDSGGQPARDIWDELDSEHQPDPADSGADSRDGRRDDRRSSGGGDVYGRGPDDSRGDSRGDPGNGRGLSPDNLGRGGNVRGQRPGNTGGPGNKPDSWRGKLGLDNLDFRNIPWEHPEQYGYVNGFFETCKRILLSPLRFFGEMEPTASVWPKLVFACFWKFFDLILTFTYRPDILQKVLQQSEISLHEGNTKVMVVIMAVLIITLVMLGMFMLGAFICRVCATIVLHRKVDFQTCLAVVCYPNVLLIFSVLPFSFITLPLAMAMGVFNGLALYKGFKLNNIEFLKILLLLLLSGLAFGAVLAVLINILFA